jgi:hypothetical protein
MHTPAAFSASSTLSLVLRLIALRFVSPRRFCVFSTGVLVSVSQVLSLGGERYTSVNKHIARQYGVQNAGDRVRVSDAWERDRGTTSSTG